jgi:hypothetical protein
MKERERTGNCCIQFMPASLRKPRHTGNRIMTPHAAKLEPAALQNYARFKKYAHTFHGSNCKQTRKEKKSVLELNLWPSVNSDMR